MKLVARPIGKEDFAVLEAGEPVGRIRHASERTSDVWLWNVTVPLPMPPWCNGGAASREEAFAGFRAAWARFKAQAGPERLAAALQTARDAGERSRG